MGILSDGGVEDSSYLVSSYLTTAEGRRRLNSPFPREDAIGVICRVIAGVSGRNVVSDRGNAASIQLPRLTEVDDNILNGAVWTGDGDCNGGSDGVHGRGVGVADEFEVVASRDPVAGGDVEITFHAGRAYGEALGCSARAAGEC